MNAMSTIGCGRYLLLLVVTASIGLLSGPADARVGGRLLPGRQDCMSHIRDYVEIFDRRRRRSPLSILEIRSLSTIPLKVPKSSGA